METGIANNQQCVSFSYRTRLNIPPVNLPLRSVQQTMFTATPIYSTSLTNTWLKYNLFLNELLRSVNTTFITENKDSMFRLKPIIHQQA